MCSSSMGHMLRMALLDEARSSHPISGKSGGKVRHVGRGPW